MKKIENILVSGLIGTGIGMIWMSVEILLVYSGKDLSKSNIAVPNFLFWVVTSFLIGIFFCLAGLVFNNDEWSLKKQIVINFFICLAAWLVFNFYLSDFRLTSMNFALVISEFLIMYVIAYGLYFYNLWNEIKEINAKLKQNRRK